jgi:two-component system cell cycle sensor histidine kinase/response regulator CckA
MTSGGTTTPKNTDAQMEQVLSRLLSPSNLVGLSPDLYRSLGDLTPGFLWLVDTQGHFVYANLPWEQFTGSNLEQLNGVGWERFNHPDEVAEVRERWDRAAKHGEQFEMELRYRRHDGEYRWMLARVVPLRNPDGQLQGWLGSSVDIHDLKTTQHALRERECELNDFIENAAVPIHWVGPDGTILRANQAELDLLGYTRDEYVGRNIVEIHDDSSVIHDILRRLTSGETLHNYPARLRCKNGSIMEVLIDSSGYFQDGQFIHTRCFTRDVTAQRGVEQATARLAAIVASSADAIVGKTLDGVVMSWNAAAERIFGYTEQEMVGSSVFRLIPADLHDAERDLLEQIRGGEAVQFSETERIRKDGRRIYIALSVSPILDAQGRVTGASSIKRDVTERRQAREALAQSQERLQLALKAARMGTWRWEVGTNELSWDEGLNQLYGVNPDEPVTRFEQFVDRIYLDDRPYVHKAIERAMEGAGGLDYEFRIVLPDGRIRWLADQGRVVRDSAGKLLYMTGVCLDVTERKQAEERLRQAQRMDSVGQLAGGIAHEANNMMSVVLGCADYVLQRTDLAEPVRQDVDQIWRAAKRTAGITQQLLAFSRRQVLQPQVLDLNATVRELEPILTRALGENRGLRMHLSPTLGAIRADPGQLEQVLLNLTLNARDAMEVGGRLTIETMNVVLDAAYAAAKPVETLMPGDYAALVVTDTGHGMDRATLRHIFEPFFTTKPVGQGTGLGLSTVYGIVKQSGGFIWVYSELGLGTTFKLYFPLVASSPDQSAPPTAAPAGRPEEVILIAEDEPMVRNIMARTLRDCGYGVLEAADGRQALELVESRRGRVSLIVADVVMPDLGGREMASRVAQRWPDVPVLFTSGYTGLDVVRRGLLEEGREFVQKPLAPEALARKVREMVDARSPVP